MLLQLAEFPYLKCYVHTLYLSYKVPLFHAAEINEKDWLTENMTYDIMSLGVYELTLKPQRKCSALGLFPLPVWPKKKSKNKILLVMN